MHLVNAIPTPRRTASQAVGGRLRGGATSDQNDTSGHTCVGTHFRIERRPVMRRKFLLFLFAIAAIPAAAQSLDWSTPGSTGVVDYSTFSSGLYIFSGAS